MDSEINVCRTCESPNTLTAIDTIPDISKILSSIFNIWPHTELNLICNSCIKFLKSFHLFRLRVLSTEAKLQEKISKMQIKRSSSADIEPSIDPIEEVTVKVEIVEAPKKVKTPKKVVKTQPEPFEESSTHREGMSRAEINEKLQQFTKHSEKFYCEICTKTTSNLKCLRRHYLLLHAEKKYRCQQCDKAYPSEKQLITHINIHTKREMYICDICNGSFLNIKYIREHMARQYPPHICEICGKAFKFPRDLKEHKSVAHDGLQKDKKSCARKEFHCKYCQKILYTYCGYRLHIKTHEGTSIHYQCEYCGKSYTTRSIMDRHVKGHHFNEKPYQCDLCDRLFTSKHLLKRHSFSHTGKRPYNCQAEGCTQGHYALSVLKKHMMRVHGLEYKSRTSIPWSRRAQKENS